MLEGEIVGADLVSARMGADKPRPYMDQNERLLGRVCTVCTTEMLRMAKAAWQ